jgi:hypothetical protein
MREDFLSRSQEEMDTMIKKAFGIESCTSAMVAVIGMLVAGGFGFAYATGRINIGTLLFLGALAVALVVVAIVFVRRMNDPDESMEQMLYKTDHPTRRTR